MVLVDPICLTFKIIESFFEFDYISNKQVYIYVMITIFYHIVESAKKIFQ